MLLAAVLHGASNAWGGYIDVYRGYFGGIITFMVVSVLISTLIVLLAGSTNLSRTNKRNALVLVGEKPERAQSLKGEIRLSTDPK